MRKTTKIVCIIAAVALGLGIVCMIVGLMGGASLRGMGFWRRGGDAPVVTEEQFPARNGDGHSGEKHSQQEYLGGAVRGNSIIDGLDMEFDSPVAISISTGDKFSLSVDGYDEFVQYGESGVSTDDFKSYMEGTTWVIETLRSVSDISITIPAGCEFKNVEISTEGTDMSWSVPFTADRLKLDVERGSFYMDSAVSAQYMELSGEGADITIEGTMTIAGAEVEMDGGGAQIADVSGGCNWNVACDMGEVEVHSSDSSQNYNYIVDARSSLFTVNGEQITAERRINAPYTIRVEDAGTVSFYFDDGAQRDF